MLKKISLFTDLFLLNLTNKKIEKDAKDLKFPYYLIYFLIYIEDKRFYYHFGLDFIAILRAFIMNCLGKNIQGGSTILQQLYDIKEMEKNKEYIRERKITRKISQIIFLKNFFMLSKQKILREYLRNIYLGKKIYGIEEASQYYFKKDILLLNKNECFILIEKIASPNKIRIKRIKNILNRYAIRKVFNQEELDILLNKYLEEGKNGRRTS